MNDKITILENKPKVNLKLEKAYQNIYRHFEEIIGFYSSLFYQQLATPGIVKGLSVLLLVDGSGSMAGERRNYAMISSIIVHEVLKSQGISHAIVEHRASLDRKRIYVNVLADFNTEDEEKYNLLQMKAEGFSKDGFVLQWAEKYLKKYSEDNLLIVISDGIPTHEVEDTKRVVNSMNGKGVKMIAVTLDDGDEEYQCFEQLREIYPDVIACPELHNLSEQLLYLILRSI